MRGPLETSRMTREVLCSDLLLQAYPEVHPENFVTFGILQEQPCRGTHREWGELAGVLLWDLSCIS